LSDKREFTGTRAGATYGTYYGRDGSHHTEPDSSGWREPTPYWGYKYTVAGRGAITNLPKIRNGSWIMYGNTVPIVVDKALPPGVNLITYRPLFSDLQTQAIMAALADLGSATAELGVELKEAQKTAEFIGEKLTTIARCAKALSRGQVPRDWRKAWRAWKGDIPHSFNQAFVQQWLEYRYAWSPLVLGVYDAMSLLDSANQHPPITTVRKRSESASHSIVSSGDTYHGSYYTMPCSYTTDTSETKSAYAVLSFTPKVDASLLTANAAGVLNPATVWWEVIPFSFVVDWFLGVGDYLNAQQALRLYALKGGTVTHRHEWLTDVSYSWTNRGDQVYCTTPNVNQVTAGGSSFNRVVVNAGDLTPTVVAGKGLNCVRGLDAISLLYSLFRGGKTKSVRL